MPTAPGWRDDLALDLLAVLVPEAGAQDREEPALVDRLAADALEPRAHAASSKQDERDVEHPLERGDRHALGRLVVALGAVGEVDAREAGRLQGVGVRPAAGLDPPRLVAAGAQRRLRGDELGGARAHLEAGEELLAHDVDVALGLGGAVVQGVDHPRHDVLDPRVVERAGLGEHAAALGHDVRGAGAAAHRADVGGRLRRRCGRAASRRSPARRRAPRCGRPRGGCRRARTCRGRRPRAGSRSARRRRPRRSGSRGRTRSRTRSAGAPASNALAPTSASSSETVNSSSSPTGEPSIEARRATSSITATAALLSAPRMPSWAFSQPPSTSTGSIGASVSTVSRWAHSSSERSPRPSSRASTLPVSSSSGSSPMPRSSAITRSAHARSCPNGLGMRQSSVNSSASRAFSASDARLTCCVRPGAP